MKLSSEALVVGSRRRFQKGKRRGHRRFRKGKRRWTNESSWAGSKNCLGYACAVWEPALVSEQDPGKGSWAVSAYPLTGELWAGSRLIADQELV